MIIEQMSSRNGDSVAEDFLDSDPAIRGQEFVCLSFISPENVLQKKELFFFQRFMKFYEAKVRFDTLESFLAKNTNDHNEKVDGARDQISHVFKNFDLSGMSPEVKSALHDLEESLDKAVSQTRVNIQDTFDSFREYASANREKISSRENIQQAYEDFMFTKGDEMEDEFHAENDFRTSVRGLKVRGVYSTHKEACARAKKLQQGDPAHNVYVGQVGYWLPWDPDPSKVGEQEYAEKELNELMKKYRENMEKRKEVFEADKNAKLQAAREEANARKQLAAGDEEGETNLKIMTESSLPTEDGAGPAPVTAIDEVESISEARKLMKEMDESRIDVNPSQVYVPPKEETE